jgi:WD40 repeat protein
MTSIFISHSSADNESANAIKRWLEEKGHTSLFLDFDPKSGIKAGSNWEQTLYEKLRQCQAVIALLTPHWLESKWCFAELVQAREKGKAIFPVKLKPCDASGIFDDVQQIDLTTRSEEGYHRLKMGLLERGLDPFDVFDWDPNRPPYPGLLAFQEEDAAVFLGRGEEILRALEALDALRRQGRSAAHFLLFLGASGSGKSSLVRAGIIPRLKKKPSEWLPVPAFRPQGDPLDECAVAISAAFGAFERPREWSAIRSRFQQATDRNPDERMPLLELARDLSIAAKQPETTVLLTIDQAEELFGYGAPENASRFLRLLRDALERGGGRLMAIATLRSDFLAEFQKHPILQDRGYNHQFAYRAIPVDPLPERNFPEIIRGPARLAGLELEDGLVESMVRDTGTRDALPLLAFTLRRLYERHSQDGRLEIRDYDDLGRLEGAISEAAKRLLAEASPSDSDIEALRAAFVPTMVRINAEGAYTRRRAFIDEMPLQAVSLLRRFVDRRLLVVASDKDGRETIEVAHEALLRTWPQLNTWLVEDQDKLRLLESTQHAAREWDESGRRPELLIHRDGRLKDAKTLIAIPRFALPEASIEKKYIDACSEAQSARETEEREAQDRRIRDAERIAAEQKKAAAAQKRTARITMAGLAVALMLALVAGWQYKEADEAKRDAERNAREASVQRDIAIKNENLAKQRADEAIKAKAEAQMQSKLAEDRAQVALSRQLAAQALSRLDSHLDLAFLLSLEASRIRDGAQTRTSILSTLAHSPRLETFLVHQAHEIGSVVFSPKANLLASAGRDGSVKLWDMETRQPIMAGPRGYRRPVTSLAFGPNGRMLAWGDVDGVLNLWDVTLGKPLGPPLKRHSKVVWGLAFSKDGKILATGSYDRSIILWDVSGLLDARPAQPLSPPLLSRQGPIFGVDFSRDGSLLAAAALGGVTLWDIENGQPLDPLFDGHSDAVYSVAFSPDGKLLASGSKDERIVLWDVATRQPLGRPLTGHSGAVNSVTFDPAGKVLVSGSADETVRLWDVRTGQALDSPLKGHSHVVRSVTVSQDRLLIASSGEDGKIVLWRMSAEHPLGSVLGRHEDRVSTIAFGPDGKRLAAGLDNGHIVLWDLVNHKSLDPPLVAHQGPVNMVAFSPDGKILASGGDDKKIVLWNVASSQSKPFGRPLLGHKGKVSSVVFNPDGDILASGSADATVILWDVKNLRPLDTPLIGHKAMVWDLAFSPDGQTLASCSVDRSILMWNLAERRQWGTPLKVADAGRVYNVAFSPEGRFLASSHIEGRRIILWDIASRTYKPFFGHKYAVWGIDFSPDGKTLASAGSADKTVILWDVASRQRLGPPLTGHTDQVVSVAFSPDGKTLASCSDDKTVRLWDVDSDSWKTRACRFVNRNLTCLEWQQYLNDKPYHKTCRGYPVPADCE